MRLPEALRSLRSRDLRDAWGLPPVLSALGILFSIVFVLLFLPLLVRERALSPADARGESA